MSNLITKDNLQLASQRSKTFTQEKILELTNTLINDLSVLSDLSEVVDFLAASGLYIDEDGDISQGDVQVEDDE